MTKTPLGLISSPASGGTRTEEGGTTRSFSPERYAVLSLRQDDYQPLYVRFGSPQILFEISVVELRRSGFTALNSPKVCHSKSKVNHRNLGAACFKRIKKRGKKKAQQGQFTLFLHLSLKKKTLVISNIQRFLP